MKISDQVHRVIIIVTMLSSVVLYSYGQEVSLPSKGICAHRGAMDTHPENTIAAFEEAIRLGVQMIELDVRMTKDKKLVIMHDESVDRTSDGSGEIKEMTLKSVKKLDAGSWKSAAFKDLRVPTFSEALAVMPRNIWLNVHLKGDRELGREVAKVIVKEKREGQAFLACGTQAADGAQEVSSKIMICNMERQDRTEDYVSMTIKNNSQFIQLYKVPVSPDIKKYTQFLKANDVKVNYCCTDSPKDVEELLEYGVDFVLVNEVGMIMNAVNIPD